MKENMKRILREKLLEAGVLEAQTDIGLEVAAMSSTVASTPVEHVALTFEQRKHLLELKLEMRQQEVRRLKIVERMSQLCNSGHDFSVHSFDIRTNLRLVLLFFERDPDTFFSLFERVAGDRHWSDAKRTLLLQYMLTGRAQEAYSALTVAESRNYASV